MNANMNGPLGLLILIIGFAAIYTSLLVMEIFGHTLWFWAGGTIGSLGCYFTIFGIGITKGWWKTS
jgi:hypothetical protein